MSSKNKPAIQSLVSAITNGLTPGQFLDLAQKISDDLDKVFTQVNTGPIPRILTSEELGGNVAYTDVFDTFEKGIGISGGIAAAGSITFDAVKGFLVQSKLGSTNDFELDGPTGTLILSIPTGTITPVFEGLTTFKLGLKVSGGVAAAGTIIKSVANGLMLTGVGGTTFDFALLDTSGAFGILLNPTGTTDLQYQGNWVQLVGKYLEILERSADPANGPVNSGRLYCKDNGAGKTQLCVRFNTGAAIVLATEV